MDCSYFQNAHCRSCTLLDKSYQESLNIKQAHLESLFPDEINKISSVIGVESPKGSRNKAKLAAYDIKGQLQFGYYESDGTFKELEHCPLHDERLNLILVPLKEFFQLSKTDPYELHTRKGELKYILLSTSEDQVLLRIVLRSKESLDRLRKNLSFLQEKCPFISVVTANIQPAHAALLEGEEEIVLTEQKVIWHQFDEFHLALGARSFFQVTPSIAKKLYGTLSEKISQKAPPNLLDLYCGVGAFSFYASRACKEVTGVEISEDAIECALVSAEKNHKKITFTALDVEKYLQKTTQYFDAVLVNPPRRGLSSSITSNLKRLKPRFIYYSSCNALSLQRDYAELREHYEICDLKIFDMFPFTEHYETLMCLERK